MTKILSRDDVTKILTIEDTIEILEKAFTDLSNANADMPLRTPIFTQEYEGLSLFMPAYLKGIGALGTKIVTVYKNNPAKFNMPTILGTILLLDEKTGAPVSIMEAGYLTAMRTGGVAGLATKYLARKNSETHVLFGTGGMALSHALAVDRVREIKRLILYSNDSIEKIEAFRNSLKGKVASRIEIYDDPQEAAGEASILTLITSAKDPLINSEWIKPGAHINGVGAHTPATREIDGGTVVKSKVVCDSVEACGKEAGDLMIPADEGVWSWDKVHGSLGDVITNKIPARENGDEITLFKSVGLAIQDISTASHVYQKAVEQGIGLDFKF